MTPRHREAEGDPRLELAVRWPRAPAATEEFAEFCARAVRRDAT